MSQAKRLLTNSNRLPPNNGTRSTATAAAEPDPKREAFLDRLNELRSWLNRKHTTFLRPCADLAAVEDLTRLVNLIANAERAGRSNVAKAWTGNTPSHSDSPGPENWIG